MKRLLLIPAAALMALSACNESPAGGDADVVLVQVMPDERTLSVGETLEMELTLRDEAGEVPTDSLDVVWSTSNPAVASVSTTGVVTGVGAGQASIRAELGGVSDEATVTVAAAPAACAGGGTLHSLEVGGSVTLGGIAASTVCLSGGVAGSEYVAVPFHSGAIDADFTQVQLGAQEVVPVAPLSPSVAPGLSLARGRPLNDEFHERLRLRAERELAPHVYRAIASRGAAREGDARRPSQVLNLRSPTVGQQVQVNVSSEESCEEPRMRTGRVAAVGQRSVVLADVGNPAGGLTEAEYASFAAGFDTLVHPAVTQAFGDPGDVDDNGRVVIFYTRAVNELTDAGSGAYVGGFFHPRDLFPTRSRDGLSGCEGSNYAEMFYMLVPDPNGEVNGNAFSRELVLQTSLGTIAHEYQHLISASRRLYQVGTTHWNEDTWLNEALSHVAEEVMFYRASGRGPRQNLGLPDIQASGRVTSAYITYMDQNIRRFEKFLEDPEGQSPYEKDNSDANDLPTRGAGWSFMRYVADRRGGSDNELWRALVDGSTTGLPNLQRVLGMDPRPWVRDWTVGVFADDAVPGLEPRFQHPSWRYRTFFAAYPLRTRRVGGPGTTEVFLKSGSGAFVRFGVLPAGQASITTRNAGQPLPSSVYLTIVRTK
ncbi:MAG TPA: Ig-like domain-containing protein [Longimicrobium sp.]|jgi:hypothetical protein|uniref:Ig-like domain-containing protein n=1 Tax=Longimicrobium sp. TaxID=2029185 RepID=UPI002EDAD472